MGMFSGFGEAFGYLGDGMGVLGELVIVHSLRLINWFACRVHWFWLHVWAFRHLQWWDHGIENSHMDKPEWIEEGNWVSWRGQYGTITERILRVTEPQAGNFLLWTTLYGHDAYGGFPISYKKVRPATAIEIKAETEHMSRFEREYEF